MGEGISQMKHVCSHLCDIEHKRFIFQDNYNKCDLKPKKPRKKTKPSALTRPPKKGKKKKNQKKSSVRPQKPILEEHAHSQSGE